MRARNTFDSDLPVALESDFEILLHEARLAFQVVLWPVVLVGLVGNGAVLCRIILAPSGKFAVLKPFYRSALISFAVSDLLLLLSSGVNTLTAVSDRRTALWKLPDWTCSAIPYFQTIAVFAGALTLAGIAIDRYRALTPKYPPDEHCRWLFAVISNILIWTVAIAASYPVSGIYQVIRLYVVREDYSVYEGRLCATDQKHTAAVYTALFITIFMPLALIFVTVHVLLALNIWRRQEQSNKSQLSSGNDSQSTEFSSVSNGVPQPRRQPPRSFTSNHIRRKKRTVNVILALILVFLIGRLPVWIFLLYKQHVILSGVIWPHLQIAFSGLTFLNAALDPFLYAFLCEALSLLAFLRASCCTKKKQANVTSRDDEGKTAIDVNPAIVPRGPYCF